MKIKDVAEAVGVNTETIKNWERSGLLPEPKRTALGHRLYTQEDLVRIQKLIDMKMAGKND
jgi:DNA-binding transcriptional MerR regulator